MAVIANILIAENGWDVGKYVFKRLPEGKKHRQEYHRASFQFTGKTNERKSVLYEGGREIYDIIFFYNFYFRGNACMESDFSFFNRNISEGIRLIDGKFHECINKSLETIRRQSWKRNHMGKILPFNWFLRSRVRDELQIAFFNKWLVFELLANHSGEIDTVLRTTLGVKNFLRFRKYWREIRNCIAHQGRSDYTCFRRGLTGMFPGGAHRFSRDEKKLFRRNILKRDFLKFQADSEFIMDIVLTIYFSYLFGINNPRDSFHRFYIQNLQYYDSNLRLPPIDTTKAEFKIYKKP